MVEILRRPTKITQPRLQGFTVDVSGVYPALRHRGHLIEYHSVGGKGGGGLEGGKGRKGVQRSTRRSWIIILSPTGYHQKRHLGI